VTVKRHRKFHTYRPPRPERRGGASSLPHNIWFSNSESLRPDLCSYVVLLQTQQHHELLYQNAQLFGILFLCNFRAEFAHPIGGQASPSCRGGRVIDKIHPDSGMHKTLTRCLQHRRAAALPRRLGALRPFLKCGILCHNVSRTVVGNDWRAGSHHALFR
jgi:hypothetical protein